ncbi:MAG: hypothetical protein Q8K60_06925 [Parachlamydiaceae bacterium]|nr:hypothetical protein [Parachlamydiaceae bacterium]
MFYKWILFLLIGIWISNDAFALSSSHQEVFGVVHADGQPLANAKVKLFKINSSNSRLLEESHTNQEGIYQISFHAKSKSQLYLLAYDNDRPEIILGTAFQLDSQLNQIEVNELTTVATVYALAQFIEKNKIFGPNPGRENSVSLIKNLVDLTDGTPGSVISNFENGDLGNLRSTRALQIQNTLANLIAGCIANSKNCKKLFALLSENGEKVTNTFEAIHSIAMNPFTQNNISLYNLALKELIYTPSLELPPESWTLVLHYVQGGFCAPGRTYFDSKGNVWSNNNFNPPSGISPNTPGKQITVLNPRGMPILGSPIFSPFINGSGYGISIDKNDFVWIASFNGGQIAQFTPNGILAKHSAGLNFPMGIAIDQKNNLWIANMGGPKEPTNPGSVTVFLKGDPEKRIETNVGIYKPFSLAIDDQGRCWVANGGFFPTGSVTILELTKNNEIEVLQDRLPKNSNDNIPSESSIGFPGHLSSPKTIAIDGYGNGWVNNFFIPQVTFVDKKTFEVINYDLDPKSRGWGLAVDGDNLIWAASFSNSFNGPFFHAPPVVSVLNGQKKNRGQFLYSFSNPSFQHLTSLQIDSSGNVWVGNNWGLDSKPALGIITGGDGLVQFIGVATPVKTPLLGEPVNPSKKRVKHHHHNCYRG